MSRRRRYSYYDSGPYRVRRSFLSAFAPLIAFLTLVLLLGASVVAFMDFELFLTILTYTLYTFLGIVAMFILYLVFRLITSISLQVSSASVASSRAKQEKIKVKQAATRVRQEQVMLQQGEYQNPRQTRSLSQTADVSHINEDYDQGESANVPGMPEKGQVFLYRNYRKLVQAGELIIGIRADGTARIGTWQDLKILLILGNSSSGKTNTIIEKCAGAASGGGWLVICDPHGYKSDSLLRRVYPLQAALMPGTVFALEHADIIRNVQIVKHELEKRVHGENSDTPIFLVVEEFNRLQRDKDIADELKLILQTIGQEGRGFNVYAIVGAQQITYKADVRKAFISVICHRVDESESKLVIPTRYAKYTLELGTGQTFVKDADGLTEPLQQVLITVEDVGRIAARLPPSRQQSAKRPGQPQPRTTRKLQRTPYAPIVSTEQRAEEVTSLPLSSPQETQALTTQSKLERLTRQREQKRKRY